MEWVEIAGNWILVPRQPVAIIHFLGGAFVSAAPQLTYRWLLEQLAKQRYAIIATPFDSAFDRNSFDHSAIARSTLLRFESALDYLHQRRLVSEDLPIYGLGHSLGCKLHLLNNSLFDAKRAGNMLMAFNNYPAKRAIPLYEQVSQASTFLDSAMKGTQSFLEQQGTKNRFWNKDQQTAVSSFFNRVTEQVAQAVPKDISQSVSDQLAQLKPDFNAEFSPSPTETQQLIADSYGVERNLLIQFQTDDIDQTSVLHETLNQQFAELTTLTTLSGNHLTPLGQDVNWAPGRDFSPMDAVGQFVKQRAYQELNQLRSSLVGWLDEKSL